MQSIRTLYKVGKGPSSSHTMGPERAAKLFREMTPEADRYEVILYGSPKPASATERIASSSTRLRPTPRRSSLLPSTPAT